VACSNQKVEDASEKENENQEGSTEVEEGVKLEDMAGRRINLPDNVEKIYSTRPVGTILLYSLNPDKMVGWNYDLSEGEKDFIAEKYHDLPNLRGAAKESINIEEILKIDPDIVIALDTIDETTIAETEELQEDLGKPVILLDEDINTIDTAYNILGKVSDEEAKAEELASYCKETLEDAKKYSSQIAEDEKVDIYYAEGSEGLETEPAGSWHGEVIDLIGGHNVAEVEAGGSKGKAEVSIEQLLTWNPELIISWGDERGGYYAGIFEDPTWKDIDAVQNKEVYEIPNRPFNWFDRPPSANR